MSAIPVMQVADSFTQRQGVAALEAGEVVLLGGGTGNPFFTTDTAAALRDAARRATLAGFTELAVISAVGTRAWYRDHGFRDGAMYQHLSLLPRHPAANVDPADAPRSPGAPDAADPPRR